jgi:hypothetical protein
VQGVACGNHEVMLGCFGLGSRVTRSVSGHCRVIRWSSLGDPARTDLTGGGDRSDQCGLSAAQVACSVAFSSRLWWLLVPMISSTSVRGLGQLR